MAQKENNKGIKGLNAWSEKEQEILKLSDKYLVKGDPSQTTEQLVDYFVEFTKCMIKNQFVATGSVEPVFFALVPVNKDKPLEDQIHAYGFSQDENQNEKNTQEHNKKVNIGKYQIATLPLGQAPGKEAQVVAMCRFIHASNPICFVFVSESFGARIDMLPEPLKTQLLSGEKKMSTLNAEDKALVKTIRKEMIVFSHESCQALTTRIVTAEIVRDKDDNITECDFFIGEEKTAEDGDTGWQQMKAGDENNSLFGALTLKAKKIDISIPDKDETTDLINNILNS
jgi:hypothetical protein